MFSIINKIIKHSIEGEKQFSCIFGYAEEHDGGFKFFVMQEIFLLEHLSKDFDPDLVPQCLFREGYIPFG